MKHVLGISLSCAIVSSGGAQEVLNADDVDMIIELGFGGKLQPSYEGSNEYEVSPFPVIGVGYLAIPGLFTLGNVLSESKGLSFGPSFNYTSDRDFNDDPALVGLNNLDATFEAGIRASYEWSHAEVWGEARYAFGGADGFVGEFGLNAIAQPSSQLELRAGPFATLASDDYIDSYFGVTPSEALATWNRIGAFDPEGGFKSVGVKATARYEFRPNWFMNGEASYSKLIGDVADSPIVRAGDEDQFSIGIGISRRFSLNLFN